MKTPWLTDAEVAALTRRIQPTAQCRVLRNAGITYQLVDGRPVVPRAQFNQTAMPPEPQLRLV